MKQTDEIKEIEKNTETPKQKRRKFLKKAAYSAPMLIALGQLVKPTKAQADSGSPSGPPSWGGF